jgi:hypothetical protein
LFPHWEKKIPIRGNNGYLIRKKGRFKLKKLHFIEIFQSLSSDEKSKPQIVRRLQKRAILAYLMAICWGMNGVRVSGSGL